MDLLCRIAFTLTILIAISNAHPYYHYQFTNIVNSNSCLKQCMDNVFETEHDLNILKTANVMNYLLNINQICKTIATSRECIDKCNVSSNPFALESMQVLCRLEVINEIKSLNTCLKNYQNKTKQSCQDICGNYDVIIDKVDDLSKQYNPSVHDPETVAAVMEKVNGGCMAMKCTQRCIYKHISEHCDLKSGEVFRNIIERVLTELRRDLERTKSSEINRSIPIQCNYMYTAEVMFNPHKDELSLNMIIDQFRKEKRKMY